jgi:hypothetical protein
MEVVGLRHGLTAEVLESTAERRPMNPIFQAIVQRIATYPNSRCPECGRHRCNSCGADVRPRRATRGRYVDTTVRPRRSFRWPALLTGRAR